MTDDFTRGVFKIISARAAREKGFTTISEVALDILVEAAISRLSAYARAASETTAHCGRTDTNALDVFCGLARFRENVETLARFLNRGDTFPAFEFLIEPYPIPSRDVKTVPPDAETIPFRANMSFGSGHIPSFFPAFPERYTYEQTVVSKEPTIEGAEAALRREQERTEVKRSLDQIMASRGEDAPHAVEISNELSRLVTNDLMARPPPKSLTSIAGAPERLDPEQL